MRRSIEASQLIVPDDVSTCDPADVAFDEHGRHEGRSHCDRTDHRRGPDTGLSVRHLDSVPDKLLLKEPMWRPSGAAEGSLLGRGSTRKHRTHRESGKPEKKK